MRNLKRALSLALASVMLLGMMVVGTSAASYPDVDENDNVEAIEVLNAVNVMIGKQGNFEPDELVNRHEMAVIMAKLYLGVEIADGYVGSHPFTDVVPWADKYVAACYENGLVLGTSATTYGGSGTLTAVQAAAMMLRALGYKDLNKGYQGDWRAPITAMANQIRLFDGVASNPNEYLNRNQVAQLALNTLKSPMVNLKDNTISWSNDEGQIIMAGGSREYIVLSSRESYAYAINDVESSGNSAAGINGATVELGEHLYNGKLRLNSTTDVFKRPARHWEYDGKAIGTYVKEELLRATYTTEVTGKTLYDLLTKNTIDKYGFTIAIDGVDTDEVSSMTGYFTKGNLVSTNTRGVGATGKGVTTEVYVDSVNERVYIAVINTYLAKAAEKYNEKRDEVKFNVWALEQKSSPKFLTKNTDLKPDKTSHICPLTVTSEDFGDTVKDYAKNDIVLVRVADNEIQEIIQPEVIDKTVLSSFSKGSWVNNGTKYDYANTARYNDGVLDEYSKPNMKEVTYNLYLDGCGYMIGIERNSDPDQYVFLTGIDAGSSNLKASTSDANVIHVDGTMKTVKVNMNKSKLPSYDGAAGYKDRDGNQKNRSQLNTWCTYSVDNAGVYTLTEVAYNVAAGSKLGQYSQDMAIANHRDDGKATKSITEKRTSLIASYDDANNKATSWVYGNDDTKYINVELKGVIVKDGGNGKAWPGATAEKRHIIDDVDTVVTGIKDVNLVMKDKGTAVKNTGTDNTTKYNMPYDEIYTLFKEGIVIAAVTIGEDNGSAATWAYITSAEPRQEDYYHEGDSAKAAEPGEWTWYREAIVDGKLVDLVEIGDTLSYIKAYDASDKSGMRQGCWYEVKKDADGNVRKAEPLDEVLGASRYLTASNDVEGQVNTENGDVVLHMDFPLGGYTGKEKLTFKNGNLYTNSDDTKGFSVSKDVKVVLGQAQLTSDAKGGDGDKDYGDHGKVKYVKQWKYKDDAFEGYEGLKSALDRLDANFVGDLNVIFHNGAATVIVINDIWGEYIDEGSHTGNGGGGNRYLYLEDELSFASELTVTASGEEVKGTYTSDGTRYRIADGDKVVIRGNDKNYFSDMTIASISNKPITSYRKTSNSISFTMPDATVYLSGYFKADLKPGEVAGYVGDDVGNLKATFKLPGKTEKGEGESLGKDAKDKIVTITLTENKAARAVSSLVEGKAYIVTVGSKPEEIGVTCKLTESDKVPALVVEYTVVQGDIDANEIVVHSVNKSDPVTVDANGSATVETDHVVAELEAARAEVAKATDKSKPVSITIDASSGTVGGDKAAITLTADTVDSLANTKTGEGDDASEVKINTIIKTDMGDVTIPAAAMAIIAKATGEDKSAEIVIQEVELTEKEQDALPEEIKAAIEDAAVLELTVKVDGKDVLSETALGESALEKPIVYKYDCGTPNAKFVLAYLDGENSKTLGAVTADKNGIVTIELSHLSQYALIPESSTEIKYPVKITVEMDAGVAEVSDGTTELTESGTLTADKDEKVALTVTLQTGYEVESVKAGNETIAKGTDGKYTVTAAEGLTVTITTKNPTAEAYTVDADGMKTYGTLTELLPASGFTGEKTVVLQKDVAVESGALILRGKLTLDLNGYTISGAGDSTYKYLLAGAGKSEVTVTSSAKAKGTVKCTATGGTDGFAFTLWTSTATLSNLNLEGITPVFIQGSGANLTIENCTITGSNAGIATHGTAQTAGGKIAVSDTTIDGGESDAMYLPGAYDVTVTDCTMTGAQGIGIKSGSLTVNGDTRITATKEKDKNLQVEGSGIGQMGAAIAIESYTPPYAGRMTIKIASTVTLISQKGSAIYENGKVTDIMSLTYEGATLQSAEGFKDVELIADRAAVTNPDSSNSTN